MVKYGTVFNFTSNQRNADEKMRNIFMLTIGKKLKSNFASEILALLVQC